MSGIDTHLQRLLLNPYWCMGDPLAWRAPENGQLIGIGNLALEGLVGSFNLAWVALGRTTPPAEVQAYRSDEMRWVAAAIGMDLLNWGKGGLLEQASRLPMQDFASWMLGNPTLRYSPFGSASPIPTAFRKRLQESLE